MKKLQTYVALVIRSLFCLICTCYVASVFANLAPAPVIDSPDVRLQQLLHNPESPVAGNPAGEITVVEFLDYQCPHCMMMADVVSAVIKQNPTLRVVYKEFPIRGPVSVLAARAALAANKQGRYLQLSRAMFAENQSLSKESILNMAAPLGIDVKKLEQDMDSIDIINQIRQNFELAILLHLPGTPAFFVGRTSANNFDELIYFPGGPTLERLQGAIDTVKKGNNKN